MDLKLFLNFIIYFISYFVSLFCLVFDLIYFIYLVVNLILCLLILFFSCCQLISSNFNFYANPKNYSTISSLLFSIYFLQICATFTELTFVLIAMYPQNKYFNPNITYTLRLQNANWEFVNLN